MITPNRIENYWSKVKRYNTCIVSTIPSGRRSLKPHDMLCFIIILMEKLGDRLNKSLQKRRYRFVTDLDSQSDSDSHSDSTPKL